MGVKLPNSAHLRPRRAVERPPPTGLMAERVDVDGISIAVLEYPIASAVDQFAPLTPAEQGIVALVLEGLPNYAIASRRGRSERTIANQLASIYAKLGVGSRSELAAWVARRGG
jgi:DNA-binding NarL/FixJ family response regulator